VILFYILAGVLVLAVLSIAGISLEQREKRRFEREELARLLERPTPAGKGAKPELPQARPDLSANNGRLSSHLGSNKEGAVSWQPLALPNPHLLVVGGSGSGKSQTIKAIAHDLRKATAGSCTSSVRIIPQLEKQVA